MLQAVHTYLQDFAHLFFPQNCLGCGSDILEHEQLLCAHCYTQLPETGFFKQPHNIVEKIFYGRIPLSAAASAYYFTKSSLIQHLIFQLKYKGNKEAGLLLGRLTGRMMKQSNRFNDVDIIIPLPLNLKKQKKRGYNQAALIAKGIGEAMEKPVMDKIVVRAIFTETQTHKDRVNRWQNMEGVFKVTEEAPLIGKHVLLIDDVVTTGATLEACGNVILQIPGTKLSIATVAFTL
jgi:ComF family protein